MKKSIATILLSALLTSFSGCTGKNFSLDDIEMPSFEFPDVSIPAFDISQQTLDKNIPHVENLKVRTSLSEVALEWKPIRNRYIAGYRISRSDGKGGYTLQKMINDPYAAHYTDENLNQSVFDTYTVSAYTNDGRYSLATPIKLPHTNKPITPVTYVTAVSGLPNRVKILWRIHTDPRVNGYVIQRIDANSKEWETLTTVDKRLSVEYIDTTVKPGIVYRYRVTAQTISGLFSPSSTEVKGTSKLLPPPVTGIMATTNLVKRIDIIWKAVPIQDGALYHIYASDFQDGVYSLIAKTKATFYSDKFDQDGAIRFYRVTAIDTDGLESSQKMQSAKGRTLGYLKAPKITSAKVINNRIELVWESTDPRTVSYTIYKKYWDNWQAKKVKTIGFKGTAFIDKKIKPDITYTYYVIGFDKDGIPSEQSRSVNLAVDSIEKEDDSWFSWFPL